MKVGDLSMALGLKVDEKEWNLGDAVIKQMTADLRRLAVRAAIAKMDVKKAMGAIGLPAVKARNELEGLAKTGGGVTSGFKGLVAAAAGMAASVGIGSMVKDVIDLGSALNDTSQKTGVSAENLQKWGYAAKLNSATLEDVTQGFKFMAKGLEVASKTGKGPLVDAFTQLGISMQDPAVKTRDLNALLFEVANKFSAMPDGAKKMALAGDILGQRMGANLIPTLNNGVQGLTAYGDELQKMGGILSGKAVGGLDNLGDSVDKVKTQLLAVRNEAIARLVPMLQGLVDQLSAWIDANHELIASTIQQVVEWLINAVKTLGEVVAFAVEHWKILAAILGGMVIVNGIMAIVRAIAFLQAAQTAAAIKAVWAWAAILGPILLVAAAVLALGYGIYQLGTHWTEVVNWIAENLASSLGMTVDELRDTLTELANDIINIGDTIVSAFKKAFEWITENAKKIPDLPVIKQLGDVGRWLGDKVNGDRKDHVMGKSRYQTALDDAENSDGKATALQKNDDGSWESEAQFNQRMSTNQAKQAIRMQQMATYNGGGAGATPTATVDQASLGAAAVPGGAGASVTSTNNVTINTGADPQAVKAVVDKSLQEHDERTRRATAAGLGINP